MRRAIAALVPLLLVGCGGDDSNNGTADSGQDVSTSDTGGQDVTNNDTGTQDTGTQDSGGGDAGNDGSGNDGSGDDGSTDASDGACPSSWTLAPAVDPSIEIPDGGGGVLMHATGSGTQDYTCTASTNDAGATTYAWIFVGPEAALSDCNAVVVGQHFASEGGAAAPEWQTNDGTYVVGGKKVAFTPDGGAASVPWLRLQGLAWGGSGTLSKAQWIHRLNTDGGITPTTTCDQNNAGTTEKVPYGADYYFYGP
jgi:hypothetical protein